MALEACIMDTDWPARRANQERLRELKRNHDTQQLAALQRKSRATVAGAPSPAAGGAQGAVLGD